MKSLLVTSRVTFVPRNYDDFIVGLADCPHIGGLLVLDNWSMGLCLRAIGLMALGAPRTGAALLLNHCGASDLRRLRAYRRHGKPVWTFDDMNNPEVLQLISENHFDLVINARTRCRYLPKVLAAPPLGCLNIHHGLLPEQRGTMCDLWALSEGEPAGFSIHAMTDKIDAGDIIKRIVVSQENDKNFRCYVRTSAQRELIEVKSLLDGIAQAGRLPDATPNQSTGRRHRRNPTYEQIKAMKKAGLRL